MSVLSTASTSQSVSVFGVDDVDLDKATDQIFRELQGVLNDTHCAMRRLSQIEERNETFIEAVEIYHDVLDARDGFVALMLELKGVCKQILGPCPKDMKQEYKEYLTARGVEKAAEKKEKEERRRNTLS